jgi:hypothetical protein
MLNALLGEATAAPKFSVYSKNICRPPVIAFSRALHINAPLDEK